MRYVTVKLLYERPWPAFSGKRELKLITGTGITFANVRKDANWNRTP